MIKPNKELMTALYSIENSKVTEEHNLKKQLADKDAKIERLKTALEHIVNIDYDGQGGLMSSDVAKAVLDSIKENK